MEYQTGEAEAMLKQVNEAIQSILIGAQEVRIGSRYVKRGDLGMLRRMREELQYQAAAETENGLLDNTYAVSFDRR